MDNITCQKILMNEDTMIRMMSFNSSRGIELPPESLRLAAENGFAYFAKGMIRCSQCRLLLANICDETFISAHRKYSPHCKFVRNFEQIK